MLEMRITFERLQTYYHASSAEKYASTYNLMGFGIIWGGNCGNPLLEEELQVPHRGIDGEFLRQKIKKLKHDVAPELGCIRNEHLLTITLNPDCQMKPSVTAAVNNLLDYANAVVLFQTPSYFYNTWVGCRLVPANKVNPLPPTWHNTRLLYCQH